MPIVYRPPNWEPIDVPQARVAGLLQQGARLSNPTAPSPDTLTATLPPPPGTATNINTASLEELIALPDVGIATAKRIVEARPIAAIEDLVAIAPKVTWTTIPLQF